MQTVIYGAQLIDGTGADPLPNAAVVLDEGRIVAVGPRSQITGVKGAESVDADGLVLLPGLVDTHVHLISTGRGLDAAEALATSPTLALLRTVAAMRATLDAGFTTVRDAGGVPAGIKAAVEEGAVPGPRIQLAVTILSQTGGHSDVHTAWGADLELPLADRPPAVVDGVEPMRQRVRELVRVGADWIKICTTGGVLSRQSGGPDTPGFAPDEIEAAVREAAAHGLRVMAHAHSAAGVKDALRAGVATIEHGIWLDEEALELLCRADVFLVPTLVASGWAQRHAAEGKMPAWVAERLSQVALPHRASVRAAHRAGVKIALGSDSGLGPHGSNGAEFVCLVEAGLSPMDAICSATSVAADLLGWRDRVGRLQAGLLGDLIAVDGDPANDVSCLARTDAVRLVVKGGQILKDDR